MRQRLRPLMRRWAWAALLLALGELQAATLTGQVARVVDGDTVDVAVRGGGRERVRLHGIDAPEQKQAYGQQSTRNLRQLALRRPARVELYGHDRNGRWLGRVWITVSESCPRPRAECSVEVDAGLAQLRDGLAWHYRQYADEQDINTRRRYADAERAARAGGCGLWAARRPTPPWSWRHRYSQ